MKSMPQIPCRTGIIRTGFSAAQQLVFLRLTAASALVFLDDYDAADESEEEIVHRERVAPQRAVHNAHHSLEDDICYVDGECHPGKNKSAENIVLRKTTGESVAVREFCNARTQLSQPSRNEGVNAVKEEHARPREDHLLERGRELQLEAQNRKNNEYERHGIYHEDQRSRSGFFQLCEQLFSCHRLTAHLFSAHAKQ